MDNEEGKDHLWKPGQSGNPNGRPKGKRNATTLAVEALMEGEAEELTRAAIEKAKSGDVPALRLCLERICPARKDSPITFELPPIEAPADAVAASAALLAAVAAGEVTPGEAGAVMTLLVGHKAIIDTAEIAKRLDELEAKQ